MTLNWYPKGKWPSKCAACHKPIPPSSRRAHDPATNKFYHPGCAPDFGRTVPARPASGLPALGPDPNNGAAARSGPARRSLEVQRKAARVPGFVRGDQLPPGPPRVAIYARVSTTKQETENQVVQLREYAARMGWSVAEVLKETEHGWEPEREKLQGLPEFFGSAVWGTISRWDAMNLATDVLSHEVSVSPERERTFERAAARALLLPEGEGVSVRPNP